MLRLLTLLTTQRPADACSIATPGAFSVDPVLEGAGATPPELDLSTASTSTNRGVGPTCVRGGYSTSSCDDIGTISLSFPSAGSPEPHASLDDVGYLLRVVEGTVPDGFWLDTEPYAAFHHEGTSSIPLIWIDGPEAEQEPFSFTLGVTPIDIAGNLGSEAHLPIDDPGRADDGACDKNAIGCAHRAGLTGGSWLLLLSLAAVRRRR